MNALSKALRVQQSHKNNCYGSIGESLCKGEVLILANQHFGLQLPDSAFRVVVITTFSMPPPPPSCPILTFCCRFILMPHVKAILFQHFSNCAKMVSSLHGFIAAILKLFFCTISFTHPFPFLFSSMLRIGQKLRCRGLFRIKLYPENPIVNFPNKTSHTESLKLIVFRC